MKRIALLILIAALFIFLTGCGEDSPVQETKEEIPKNLVINGPIEYWDHGDQFTLSLSKAIDPCYSSVSIAATSINSNGNFEITVPPPPDSLLVALKKENLYGKDLPGTVDISDTTVRFLIGDLLLMNGGRQWGGIDWSKSEPIDSAAGVWKYSRVFYFYFDKNVNIKMDLQGVDGIWREYAYDISAKAGWNLILYTDIYNWQGYFSKRSFKNYVQLDGTYQVYHCGIIN